jgi:hypothetical protein
MLSLSCIFCACSTRRVRSLSTSEKHGTTPNERCTDATSHHRPASSWNTDPTLRGVNPPSRRAAVRRSGKCACEQRQVSTRWCASEDSRAGKGCIGASACHQSHPHTGQTNKQTNKNKQRDSLAPGLAGSARTATSTQMSPWSTNTSMRTSRGRGGENICRAVTVRGGAWGESV